MTVRSLFVTKLYEAELGDDALLADLVRSIRVLAADDQAGLRWSREHRYSGYTSYASLNDLPKRDPGIRRPRQAADAPRNRVRAGVRVRPPPQAAGSTACGSIC